MLFGWVVSVSHVNTAQDARHRMCLLCSPIKYFLQASDYHIIICHMARLVDKITVPMARASILWLIGEYSEHVPKIAPDVLRKLAKTFTAEVREKGVFH